jgi:hypothetical protein
VADSCQWSSLGVLIKIWLIPSVVFFSMPPSVSSLASAGCLSALFVRDSASLRGPKYSLSHVTRT